MISLLTLVAAEGSEEESPIQIGHHIEYEWNGWTFNIDTIWATFVAGTNFPLSVNSHRPCRFGRCV